MTESKKDYNFFKNNLNEQQYEASIYSDTDSLIIAGAGSGKTRVLTYKMLNLLVNEKISINNILAVTFTNKAANEMKERLIDLYYDYNKFKNKETENKDKESVDDIIKTQQKNKKNFQKLRNKEVNISTFHSICNKLLRKYINKYKECYNKNFTICDSNDSIGIIKRIIKEMGLNASSYPAKDIKELISKLKSNAILSDENKINEYVIENKIPLSYEYIFSDIYIKYQKELEESNTLDFDDLLLIMYFLLRKNKEIRKELQDRYKYILVDEAQDTNWIQFELIKMLVGDSGNVTFIGDDFQSIYRWRGAVMETFLNLKKIFTNLRIFKLETNYRSSKTIVETGKNIIKNNTEQYNKDISANKKDGEKIKLLINPHSNAEVLNIVEIIKSLKEKKGFEWKDFGILYRINSLSAGFEKILLQNKIPYEIWGGFKFFERKEIKDILAYMKLIVNEDDNISLSRIVNVPSRKIGKTTLEKIRKIGIENNITFSNIMKNINTFPLKVPKKTKENLEKLGIDLMKIRYNLKNLTPGTLIKVILDIFKYEDYLLENYGIEEASERIDNIGELVNMAKGYSTGKDSISDYLNELSLLSDFSEKETEEKNTIKLMTIHAAKGLEFPIVFVVGLEDGIFPSMKNILEKANLEEERRLMYVAVTRAKDLLFLSLARQRMIYGKTEYSEPSMFLNEIDKNNILEYEL